MFINIDNKLATHGGRRRCHGCFRGACVFNLESVDSVRGCCPGTGPRPSPGPFKFAAAVGPGCQYEEEKRLMKDYCYP